MPNSSEGGSGRNSEKNIFDGLVGSVVCSVGRSEFFQSILEKTMIKIGQNVGENYFFREKFFID